jgi:hypothetical protein
LTEDYHGDSSKISELGSGVGPISFTVGGESAYHSGPPVFYSILP